MTASTARPHDFGWRTPLLIIVAGCVISLIGNGVRSSFGLYLEPMTVTRGWDRETFALALAVQNLVWGLMLPVAGGLADRFGVVRVLVGGALIYALGMWGMAEAESGAAFQVAGGLVTGLGVAFTAFFLAGAAMVKAVGPERRSLVLGIGTAASSFGQMVFSPLSQGLIIRFGWSDSLLILAFTTLVIIPLAWVLPGDPNAGPGSERSEQTMRDAVSEAAGHRGYLLLTTGFFVCGFHVAFIAVHFPAYVTDLGLDPRLGGYALAIIGLFNVAGSLGAGVAGQRWSKKAGLSLIYFLRAIVITLLLVSPKTELTIYLFAAAMGLLWLSTVPLTSGIVAQVFGVRYMATLFGFVFFSHQVGSFLGVWLGGWIYDVTGSYDPVWWAGVFFGLAAAIVHLPIDERPVARLGGGPAGPALALAGPGAGIARGHAGPVIVIVTGLVLVVLSLALA